MLSMENRLNKGYILPMQAKSIFSNEVIYSELFNKKNHRILALELLENGYDKNLFDRKFYIESRNVSSYNGSFQALCDDILAYKNKGYRIIITSNSTKRIKRLSSDLMDIGIIAGIANETSIFKEKEILLACLPLNKGFEYPLIKTVVVAENDIFHC